MSQDEVKEIPSAEEISREIPITEKAFETISKSRNSIAEILGGFDPRLLLIVGPCSIHDEKSTLEFASKLITLQKEVEDKFLIAMRVYYEKPRTLLGWKGLLLDPNLDGSCDILLGIRKTRTILNAIATIGMPTAAEILSPFSALYFQDLLAWGCIGARTAESQIHRELASSMPMPIAFKNNTDGNIRAAIEGAIAAKAPHTFLSLSKKGKLIHKQSKGNPYTHIVLRGSAKTANYFPESVAEAIELLKKTNLEKSLIVDCSHGNSNREPKNQITVFRSSLQQFNNGTKQIKGLILESHLKGGRQDLSANIHDLQYGVSLTDSCLDFDKAASIILDGYQSLEENDCESEKNLIFN